MLHGRVKVYYAQDSIPDPEDAARYSSEYLNTLTSGRLPPAKLQLKVRQPIMLLRNMDALQGMCNGTRLIVRTLGSRFIEAEILVGKFKGKMVFLPRIPLITTDDGSSPIKFCRRQFPVKPAFAMTINKSQGRTLDTVGLYLPKPVFGHGHLYVALSRCTDPNRLKILILDSGLQNHEGAYTRNIVYKNVLT